MPQVCGWPEDEYFAQQNVFDLRVLSTLGLSQADIDAIAGVEGVQAVMPVQFTDLEARWNGDEELSGGADAAAARRPRIHGPANLNRLVLLSGRGCPLPPMSVGPHHSLRHPHPGGYCAASAGGLGLGRTEFTVVGAVHDPVHSQ